MRSSSPEATPRTTRCISPKTLASWPPTLVTPADVLTLPQDGVGAHVVVGVAVQILFRRPHHLHGEPGARRRLKQGEVIEVVVLVVEHDVARDLRMRLQPGQQLPAAGVFWLVGAYIDERHAPV